MNHKLASIALLLLLASCAAAQNAGQTVTLQKKMLPSGAPLWGMTNLFFEKVKDLPVRYPPDWNEVEISPFLQNPALAPIYVIRYKTAAGEFNYVLDANGDFDFRNDPVLEFRRIKDLRIADIELAIHSPAGGAVQPGKVDYQLILSDDGYTYGRVSEYREGQIQIGGQSYAITLRPRDRNKPSFSLSGDTVCMIDLNRDGEFSSRWHLSDSGVPVPREDVELASPFMIGGERLKVVELDPAGTYLKIVSSSETVSISPGFNAPGFTVKGIDRSLYSLANLRGRVVLLEFWSVSCSFCKQALPDVNSLIKQNAGDDFIALDIAREESAAEISAYLKNQPRNATVVLNDQATWKAYNSEGITPTYYLIDKTGVVRMSGFGASSEQLKAIAKMVEQLRKG